MHTRFVEYGYIRVVWLIHKKCISSFAFWIGPAYIGSDNTRTWYKSARNSQMAPNCRDMLEAAYPRGFSPSNLCVVFAMGQWIPNQIGHLFGVVKVLVWHLKRKDALYFVVNKVREVRYTLVLLVVSSTTHSTIPVRTRPIQYTS